MKKRKLPILSLLIAFMLVITPFDRVVATNNENANIENLDITNISIVHTNDIHGRSNYSEKGKVFGFDKLKGLIENVTNPIVLDAGDTFHGQAFATLEEGESIAKLMKSIGYDAMTPGNHDWNYGKDRLKELQSISNAPILAANITNQNQESFFDNDGTIIKEINGIKVGVFGVFDQDIKDDTAPKNIEGLTFLKDTDIANEKAEYLSETKECDVVIALTHQLDVSHFVSQTSNIDLVVAGHEHAVWNEKYLDSNNEEVVVVESGKYFENVGIVDIEVDNETKDIISIKEEIHSWNGANTINSNSEVVDLLEKINTQQNIKLSEKIGSTSVELDGRWEELRIMETTLGRIITESYLQETGADVAFENAGGIRLGRKLAAGDILYKDIIDTAPFGNYIVTKQITGLELKGILEQSIDVGIQNKKAYDKWKETGSDQIPWPNNTGEYLQFGGISATYQLDKPIGQRVQTMSVQGEPLDNERMYTIATNNFVSQGGGYTALANYPELNQYSACDEALIRFVKMGQEIVDKTANRENLSLYIPEQPETPNVPEDNLPPVNDKIIPNTADGNQPLSSIILLGISGSVLLLSKKYYIKEHL